MRKLTIFALLLALASSGCTIWKEPKSPSVKSSTGAEAYERLMWKAIQAKDWKELNAHLAPTFTGVAADGAGLDRAAWIERWKSRPVTEFSLGELTVQPNGSDMVVTYELHLQGGDSPSSKGLRVVSVGSSEQQRVPIEGWDAMLSDSIVEQSRLLPPRASIGLAV